MSPRSGTQRSIHAMSAPGGPATQCHALGNLTLQDSRVRSLNLTELMQQWGQLDVREGGVADPPLGDTPTGSREVIAALYDLPTMGLPCCSR